MDEHIETHQPRPEPLWHVQLAVFAAVILYIALPQKLILGPRWVLPALECLLSLGLLVSTPKVHVFRSLKRRIVSLSLISLITITNISSLFLLVHYLLVGGKADGLELMISSVEIYITNIIIFAFWYWEIDRGGPGKKLIAPGIMPDFLFPQMEEKHFGTYWAPTFFDYFYLSSTNATAFSPTDTMPLTHRAKLLMLVQSLVSLITIALVAARAVNILS